MENPLSEEQIAKINEISKLSPEEQQKVVPEFLKTLNPEQMEFLKNQQGQEGQNQCVFCALVEDKMESCKVYEDETMVGVLDIKPLNEGQVLLISKKHVQFSTEMEEIGKYFEVANLIAKKIYEEFKLDTNILVSNGQNAGQVIPHFAIQIVPRKEGDKGRFNFQGDEVGKDKLSEVADKLRMERVLEKEVEEEKPKEEGTETYVQEEKVP